MEHLVLLALLTTFATFVFKKLASFYFNNGEKYRSLARKSKDEAERTEFKIQAEKSDFVGAISVLIFLFSMAASTIMIFIMFL